MYELIVLGLIPGTQIQITFINWLTLAAGIIGFALIWRTYRSQTLRRTIVSLALLRAVNDVETFEIHSY